MTPLYHKGQKEAARELRRESTEAERKLWEYLRHRKEKYYRQRPIGGYIVDFYSRQMKLVIEVDGKYHEDSEVQEYDKIREEYLRELGLNVMRIKNEEVMNNFEEVCRKIEEYAAAFM